ncbi:HNH endonuclease [Bacillus sonorensis]|uniref:HNH endonuclease n=1 Tax=Bacillus sonorensis TaxID=119858 RepID=UPI00098BB0A3|nr:HNH endonuclease [Bacillus sonorensis]
MNAERLEHLKKYIHLLDVDIERGLILNRSMFDNGRGYLKIALKKRSFYVHEIILVADGIDLTNLVVNHINGIKTDNRRCNLEAVTIADNLRHAYDSGLNPGKVNFLSKQQMKEIKQMALNNHPSKLEIAKMYGIYPTLVTKIQNMKL